MRLWHKDLIPYLPKQQLLAQWREYCAICSNWANKGTPNNLLVNKVINYSKIDFDMYVCLVVREIRNRGYKISKKSISDYNSNFVRIHNIVNMNKGVFLDWHNERYLKQCLFNIQEKYDCGGIPENEWKRIEETFGKYLKSNSELEKEIEDLCEYKMEHQTLYTDPMSW